MKRIKFLFVLLFIIPAILFSFNNIPRSIHGISFEVEPAMIPELTNMRLITTEISELRGKYRFIFDDRRREIVEYKSKYNKIFFIARYVGIYERLNYDIIVKDFIKCFKKRYGPPVKEHLRKAINMPEHYFYKIFVWEDDNIIMRLKTLFYSLEPTSKYWPGENGRDIIIEYINKKNRNSILRRDFNPSASLSCEGIW